MSQDHNCSGSEKYIKLHSVESIIKYLQLLQVVFFKFGQTRLHSTRHNLRDKKN